MKIHKRTKHALNSVINCLYRISYRGPHISNGCISDANIYSRLMQPSIDWSLCVRHLICPLCGDGFEINGRSLTCSQKHTFDLAKDNYVNLIPGGTKMPKFPGDSKMMLQARRRFLDSGHYQPLVNTLLELIHKFDFDNSDGPETAVLDAGCGEGYYLNQIQQGLAFDGCYYGVDLSKDAIRMAAKRVGNGRFVVANIKKQMPLADSSTHLLLNIFAPRSPTEFARLLCPNGRLLIVIPQDNHLQALRENFDLLNIQPDKQALIEKQFAPYFKLKNRVHFKFPLKLQGGNLFDLVQMMPGQRGSQTNAQPLTESQSIETEANVTIMVFG